MTKPFNFAEANLAKITDEPQELELLFNGDPIGVFVSVRGFQSETFRVHARREANAARKRAFEAERKGKAAPVRTLEDDEDVSVRLTLDLLTGWRTEIDGKSKPVIYENGREIEFSREAAETWLRTYDWVIPQINEFASEIGNFTKGSSKASPPSPPTTSD